MTKGLSIIACLLVAVDCLEKAAGAPSALPIPAWMWVIPAIGWFCTALLVLTTMRTTREGR